MSMLALFEAADGTGRVIADDNWRNIINTKVIRTCTCAKTFFKHSLSVSTIIIITIIKRVLLECRKNTLQNENTK